MVTVLVHLLHDAEDKLSSQQQLQNLCKVRPAELVGRSVIKNPERKMKTSLLAAAILLAALLNGLGQPIITTEPQSRTNVVGTDATFTVVATGTEPLGATV